MKDNAEISLSAIVLAGGLSTRMGQDKALVSITGVPLIQTVCEVALQCCQQVYVVTPWSNRYRDILVSVQFIQEVPAAGAINAQAPLLGFVQGLAHMTTKWVLLLACDLPQLQAAVFQTWKQELNSAEPEIKALLPKNPEGWWEPLCGFYRASCLQSLEQFVAQGGRSFQAWLNTQPVRELQLPDSTMLLNCNTPEDLDRYPAS